jgi:hypothetical protein
VVDLTSVVRLHWFPGVALADRNQKGGLRDWLRADNYLPISAGSDEIVLEYFDSKPLANALGYDANALAVKAAETVDSIWVNENFPKAIAWPSIKLYYSAYFSIMFLMRICCKGPVYLESGDARRLKGTASALNIVTELRAGTYSIIHNDKDKTLKLERMADGLGVHESTWIAFQSFLIDLERSLTDLIAGDEEKLEILSCFNVMTNCLQRRNCVNGNWLSMVRNEMNYRPHDGAWFPYRKGHRLDVLMKHLQQCELLTRLGEIKRSNDDEAFFAIGAALFGWFLTVVKDLALRSSGRRTVFSNGIENYIALTELRHLRKTVA